MTSDLKKAIEFIRASGIDRLHGCISTGSGQHLPVEVSRIELELAYSEIPGMGEVGLKGHDGKLVVVSGRNGNWAIWLGRLHYYQGIEADRIVFYVDISHGLGAGKLICLNSSGGLDPSLRTGDLVNVSAYRCFIPVAGIEVAPDGGPVRLNSDKLGVEISTAAEKCRFELLRGVYAGVPGPVYETPSEVAWLRKLGCNVVGMSTVPELIHAGKFGMDTAVISLVANVHGKDEVVTHDLVVRAGEAGSEKVRKVITSLIM